MEDLQRRKGESDFEWKLRLVKLKIIDRHDIEWQEIVDLLGLDYSADHFRKTAYGILEYDDYLKHDGVATRILSISDTHVPFHLPKEIFKDYAGRVDILQLNGDMVDMQSISKFIKSYRLSIMEEIIEGRQYIIDLIEYIKPKKVMANYGNHELRFQNYLSKNIDTDLLELMPRTVLDLIFNDGFNHYNKRMEAKIWYEPLVKVFSDIDIVYTGDWKSKIGKTWFAHPRTYSSAMLKTTEKAVNYFLRQDRNFDSIVLAHTHKLGSYIQGDISLFEQGCCCKSEEMEYTDGLLVLPQQQGFIFVAQNKDGGLIFDKTKLISVDGGKHDF